MNLQKPILLCFTQKTKSFGVRQGGIFIYLFILKKLSEQQFLITAFVWIYRYTTIFILPFSGLLSQLLS